MGKTLLLVTQSPMMAVMKHALVVLAGDSRRLARALAGAAGKCHFRTGQRRFWRVLLSPGDRGIVEFGTLDDLAGAMRGRLATADSRQRYTGRWPTARRPLRRTQ